MRFLIPLLLAVPLLNACATTGGAPGPAARGSVEVFGTIDAGASTVRSRP